MSCSCCYKVTLLECPEQILIECGLTPNTIYYLILTDKFSNEYVRAYQADGNGHITLPASEFPQGFFMSFSGDFTIKIYASAGDASAGENEVSVSFCGNNYTCIVVSFSSDTSFAATIPDCNQPQTPIADDELPSVTPQSFCDAVDSCMKVPKANGNYVLKILNGVKIWVTAAAGATWGSITGTLSDQTDLQNALNTKSNTGHTHDDRYYTETEVDGLLNGKANTSHTHSISDVTGLQGALDGKAATSHGHAISDVTGLSTALSDAENNAKAYADQLVVGLLDDRGNYNASGNTFPSSGGSGPGGAILKGDLWTVSVAGTLGGVAVTPGDLVRALVDAPGQTASNWAVSETNIGYTSENVANKATSMTGNTASNTVYLTAKAVYDWGIATFTTLTAVFAFIRMRLGYNMSTLYSTSSTSEIVADFYEITGNTLLVGDDLFTMVGWAGTRNAGTNRIRLGFTTTLPVVGSAPPSYTRLTQQQTTTNNAGGYNRKTFKITASNQISSFGGDTGWTEDFVSSGQINNYTYNINTTYYIMVLLTSGDATNVLQLLDNHYVISR